MFAIPFIFTVLFSVFSLYVSISVTKLAKDNDFEFKILLTVYPEVNLPDYKKIAKESKKESPVVGEDDVKKAMKNLLTMQDQMQHQGHDHKEGESCNHQESTELTDDFVSKIGPFKNVDEFTVQMKKDLKSQKENEVIGKHRELIVNNIIEKIDLEIPELLINAELDKIIAQMKDDVQKHGLD